MGNQGDLPILPRYDLDGGVCVSASPVHIADSQLVSAQNAQFDLQGSLRKRDGLTAFTSALGDSILGAQAVPLPNPGSALVTDAGVEITGVGTNPLDTYIVTTLTRSGGTVTVTVTTTIWFVVGMTITIAGATPTAYNGAWTVATIIDSNNFTFTITGTPTSPATGTITVTSAAQGGSTGLATVPTLMVPFVSVNTPNRLWRLSSDGTTWTWWAGSGTILDNVGIQPQVGSQMVVFQPPAASGTRLYYAGDPAGTSHYDILVFDGRTARTLFRIPVNPLTGTVQGPNSLCAHNGKLYVSVSDGIYGDEIIGRVFEYNPATGAVTQVGAAFAKTVTGATQSEYPVVLVSFAGRLWVGTGTAVQGGASTLLNIGKVYHTDPGADPTTAVWVLDHTTANTEGFISTLAVFNGNLYLGTTSINTTPIGYASRGVLKKRTSTTGAWATVDTGAGTGTDANTQSGYTKMIVQGSTLLVNYTFEDAVTAASRLMKVMTSSDGTTWATEEDLNTLMSRTNAYTVLGGNAILGSSSYHVLYGSGPAVSAVVKRTSGAAWSIVDNYTDSPATVYATNIVTMQT